MWIDNSHTVKATELKGRRLMKNIVTGETRLDPIETDVAELLPVSEVAATTTPNRKRSKKNGS